MTKIPTVYKKCILIKIPDYSRQNIVHITLPRSGGTGKASTEYAWVGNWGDILNFLTGDYFEHFFHHYNTPMLKLLTAVVVSNTGSM